MDKIRSYYNLTKPGIIMGNSITATAGFALASNGVIDAWLFIATLAGLGGVIASACVLNNYIDRDIDKKMARTKSRGLVTGLVTSRQATTFAAFLGIFGITILLAHTNTLASFIAFTGFFVYVVLYGFWKRRSSLGTIVGSVSGAIPPVVGYTAVTNHVDSGALILFATLVLWQMPHFYAIAIYRLADYKAADIPVLPVVKGMDATRVSMLLYIAVFLLVVPLLSIFGYTGAFYLVVSIMLAASWFTLGLAGFSTENPKQWGRKMFLFSLVVITSLCIIISINSLLP